MALFLNTSTPPQGDVPVADAVKRERSTIEFPYYDLSDAEQIAN